MGFFATRAVAISPSKDWEVGVAWLASLAGGKRLGSIRAVKGPHQGRYEVLFRFPTNEDRVTFQETIAFLYDEHGEVR